MHLSPFGLLQVFHFAMAETFLLTNSISHAQQAESRRYARPKYECRLWLWILVGGCPSNDDPDTSRSPQPYVVVTKSFHSNCCHVPKRARFPTAVATESRTQFRSAVGSGEEIAANALPPTSSNFRDTSSLCHFSSRWVLRAIVLPHRGTGQDSHHSTSGLA